VNKIHISEKEARLAFLEMAGRGCISGHVVEWSQLKPAMKWAIEQLKEKDTRISELGKMVWGLECTLKHLLWKFENFYKFEKPEQDAFLENAAIHIRAALTESKSAGGQGD